MSEKKKASKKMFNQKNNFVKYLETEFEEVKAREEIHKELFRILSELGNRWDNLMRKRTATLGERSKTITDEEQIY